MKTQIKERLEEVVELLNNPDTVVTDKELKLKLEKVLALLDNPEKIALQMQELQARLAKIVELVNNTATDLDVNVEYCIPDVITTSATCDVSQNPHILLTYAENEYTTRTRKVSLGKTALQGSEEDIAQHVLLAIRNFKEEIDDIRMG